MKILLEDDAVLADILLDNLREYYEVTHTYSMKEALLFAELGAKTENIKRQFTLDEELEMGEEVILEGALLQYLYKNKNRVVSVEEILQNLWEYEQMPSNDAVRTLIKELRKYVGHEHIKNIRSQGYRFE